MSNQKRLQFNTRERAVSTDHNRLQSFLSSELLELATAMLSVSPDFAKSGTKNFPANSLVIAGLLVRPDPGSYCTVDSGSAVFIDPAVISTDDSAALFAVSSGNSSPSTMPFVANAGPGIRTDVFECRPVEVTLETSNRDIYDPTTGLFAPSTVDKVKALQLEFRVRNGGPGLAEDPDWLPLAVAFVKTTDASYATCDFYDVRPLMAERVPHARRNDGRSVQHLDIDNYVASGAPGVDGVCRGTALGFLGCCATGQNNDQNERLRRNVPVSAAADFGSSGSASGGSISYVSWTSDCLASTMGTPVADQMVVLYCVFPRLQAGTTSLPRWQRYSQTASPREPEGPRGFLVWDEPTKADEDHTASSEISLPSHLTSCLAPTAVGFVAGMGWFDQSAGDLFPQSGGGGWLNVPATMNGSGVALLATSVSAGVSDVVTWPNISGLANVAFPRFARVLDLNIGMFCDQDGSGPRPADNPGRLELDGIVFAEIQFCVSTKTSDGRKAWQSALLPIKNGFRTGVITFENGSLTEDQDSLWQWDAANPDKNELRVRRVKYF